jgi:nitronate monooxygenase
MKFDWASVEEKMGSIERRKLLKAAAVGGVALSKSLLAPNGARAEGAPPPGAPSWPNRRLLDLLKIDHPIIQAPMGGAVSPGMPVAVCASGGLGSFPCSFLTVAQLRDVVAKIHAQTRAKPLNLNFFCDVRQRDAAVEAAWLKRLAAYYTEFGVDPPVFPSSIPPPFNSEKCDVVVELRPEVVSFHFGLPEQSLVYRLKAAGGKILSSALKPRLDGVLGG